MRREELILEIDGLPHPGLLSIEYSFDGKGALLKVVAGVHEQKGALTKKGSEAVLKALLPGEGAETIVTGRVRRTYGDEAKPALRRFLQIESKACDAVECAADGRKHGYNLKKQKLGAAADTLRSCTANAVQMCRVWFRFRMMVASSWLSRAARWSVTRAAW